MTTVTSEPMTMQKALDIISRFGHLQEDDAEAVMEEIMSGDATEAQIGAYLMGLWRFENTIIEAIAFHHLPVRSMTQNLGLLTAVHVANALNHEAQSPSGENIESHFDIEYLDKLEGGKS